MNIVSLFSGCGGLDLGFSLAGFTVLAHANSITLHPQSSKMIKNGDGFIFDPNTLLPYRRLSVRECARIQTFPDDFVFVYQNVRNGYKMVGNSVPINFAKCLGQSITRAFCSCNR